jgi:hypothetical protein
LAWPRFKRRALDPTAIRSSWFILPWFCTLLKKGGL